MFLKMFLALYKLMLLLFHVIRVNYIFKEGFDKVSNTVYCLFYAS